MYVESLKYEHKALVCPNCGNSELNKKTLLKQGQLHGSHPNCQGFNFHIYISITYVHVCIIVHVYVHMYMPVSVFTTCTHTLYTVCVIAIAPIIASCNSYSSNDDPNRSFTRTEITLQKSLNTCICCIINYSKAFTDKSTNN